MWVHRVWVQICTLWQRNNGEGCSCSSGKNGRCLDYTDAGFEAQTATSQQKKKLITCTSSPATNGITAPLFSWSRRLPYYQSRRSLERGRITLSLFFIGRVKTVWLRRIGRGRRLPRLEPTTADYDRTFSIGPTTPDPIQPDATGQAHQADSWVALDRIGHRLLGLR